MPSKAEIYLIAETVEGNTQTVERLRAAFSAAEIKSVLVIAAGTGRLSAAAAEPVIEFVRAQGAAALVCDDAALARELKADGVHLAWSKDPLRRYNEAREILGAPAIIGVDAGRSRHVAMTLGEAGADYVAFGIPAHVEDRETALVRQLDLVAWWSGIFEVPCVAFDALDLDAAARLAEAGADFVAVTLPALQSPSGVAEMIGAFARAFESLQVHA